MFATWTEKRIILLTLAAQIQVLTFLSLAKFIAFIPQNIRPQVKDNDVLPSARVLQVKDYDALAVFWQRHV